jgi:hypothetical protein
MKKTIEKGANKLILGNEEHQFANAGGLPLRFLCAVPQQAKT